ncbi:phosphotransferase family protein [Emericellopsis atlantica]|uniref:Phosphotransferase family protein n=1 Tax=Emericellopsis atlantica TaxID=2614577 RepID=A0A9P7ZLG8_9HYPO|nr:phosphotransferase family protein [Emericellopsis atlantica]KAG9253896.1 phosphotransferase family protein [Emericellopsis atlantica]
MPGSFEEFDDAAWEHGDVLFDEWKQKLYDEDIYHEVVRKVVKHRMGGDPLEICSPQRGGFNVYYRIRFAEGAGAMIRFPMPAYFQYADEKLVAEVAAMHYISDNTTIPIPFVLHHGMKEESPGGLGPFMIMEWVENLGPPILDPDINEEKLEQMYSQMADILLQLSRCNFTAIGSLGFRDEEDRPEVATRPLSLNVSQLANFARVPHFQLPFISTTFTTSSEYYTALADMHLQQLSFQRNQAIDSAEDCKKKYIARQLFRKLASESRLADAGFNQGPFKLWCDDLRPANVLVDKAHKIAAAIDWEFTYAAPAEFFFNWEAGQDDWVEKYEPRLATFLRALEAKETEFIERGRLTKSEILSSRMRESWESGQFWVTYAARRTWAFDAIFWRFLDEKFFEKNEDGDSMDRIKLLPQEQIDAMEHFVTRKLQEKEEGTLVDWYETDSEARLPPDILSVGSSPRTQQMAGWAGAFG